MNPTPPTIDAQERRETSRASCDEASLYVRRPVGFLDNEHPDRCSFDHASLSAAFDRFERAVITPLAAPPADGVLLSDERDQILHGQLRESILDLRNHLTRNRDRDMAYVIKLLDAVVSDAHTRAAPKAPTAPIGEAGEAYQGFQAAVSAIRSWAAGFSEEMTQCKLRAVAKDLEDNRAEILGAALGEQGENK